MSGERATLGDIRAIAKTTEGIRLGGWVAGDPHNVLPESLREMADDILTWFNSAQGWSLTEVRTGFINIQRIAASMEVTGGPEDGVPVARARIQQPDQFPVVFQFKAEKPPMKKRGFVKRREILDLKEVFATNFRAGVSDRRYYDRDPISVDLMPEKVGSVYPLDQAMKELSSPYYLLGVNISVTGGSEHADYLYNLQFAHLRGHVKPADPGPMKNLKVMVYARDLMDYIRIEINGLRRVQRQLDKKFPPLHPGQVS